MTKYHKYNRDKKLKPKFGLFYCYTCDRDVVARSGKCRTCGSRQPNKSIKKETNA